MVVLWAFLRHQIGIPSKYLKKGHNQVVILEKDYRVLEWVVVGHFLGSLTILDMFLLRKNKTHFAKRCLFL